MITLSKTKKWIIGALAVLTALAFIALSRDALDDSGVLQGGVNRATGTQSVEKTNLSTPSSETLSRVPGFKMVTESRPKPSNSKLPKASDDPKPASDLDVKAKDSPICGNGVVEAVEQCDDGNAATEICTYGQPNCFVCDSSCKKASGETSYCGDGQVDGGNGEQCDGGGDCDSQCQFIEEQEEGEEEEFQFTTIQDSLGDYFDEVLGYIIQKETNEYHVPNGQIDLSEYDLENENIDFIDLNLNVYDLENMSHLKTFGIALELLLDENYSLSLDIFEELDYEVIRLVDGNEAYLVIKETQFDNSGDFAKGWGTLFIKEEVDDGVFLSVPHPKFDTNSPLFGLEAYKLAGEALYVSGSHRKANGDDSLIQPNYHISDQAHNDHILTTIGEVFSNGFTDTFIEFHGHGTSNYPVLENGGYNAVISKGAASATSALQLSLISALEIDEDGDEDGDILFDGPGGCGVHFNNILCGTQNRLKVAIGGDEFLHVEVGTFYRDDDNVEEGASIMAKSLLEALQ